MSKKLTAILFGALFILTACTAKTPDFPGKERIQATVDAAKTYNSARYMITNLQTGALEEVFSFMFDEDGKQYFLDETEYIKEIPADNNIESGDGADSSDNADSNSTDGNADAMTTEIIYTYSYYNGEYIIDHKGYVTPATYTKEEPYSVSTGVLLFYIPQLIDSGSETKDPETGYTIYEQVYDIEKLRENAQAFADVSRFSTTYLYDGETFLAMTEHFVYSSGNTSDYQVEIIDINAIESIVEPEN